MQALGVKNRPSARIFNASSMLIQITKQYSVICNAGVSITRFRGVSNIIEMHDNVVMNIITQSRQVTKPRKLLEERDTEFDNLVTLLHHDETIYFNLAILTANSCTALFFPCPSKDPSISHRTSHRRTAGNISGIYFREVPRTTACRRMDGSLANHLRVDFWNGNRKIRLWKSQKSRYNRYDLDTFASPPVASQLATT